MHALEVKNLVKRFDDLVAVDNVSFTVPEGAIYGLIGRNGAGKTTTLRMIMNIYLPDEGEVFVRGVQAGNEFRERTGYLPEERGLYKKLKVWETIMFFAELKNRKGKNIEKAAEDYLKRFELWDRRNAKIEDLSKGNQQKVQFISTIIHDPDFIVLDEPFSGLDPVNTNILKEIIIDLKNRGKIIIFSTHLMDFAERMCDHIALIDKGKVVLSGNLNQIKADYSSESVKLVCKGDTSFLSTLPYVRKVEDFGNALSIKVTDNSHIQTLLSELIQRQVNVLSFVANDITLHEIFVSLVGKDNLEFNLQGGNNVR